MYDGEKYYLIQLRDSLIEELNTWNQQLKNIQWEKKNVRFNFQTEKINEKGHISLASLRKEDSPPAQRAPAFGRCQSAHNLVCTLKNNKWVCKQKKGSTCK